MFGEEKLENPIESSEALEAKFNRYKSLLIPLIIEMNISRIPLLYRQVILGIDSNLSGAFVISTMYKMTILCGFKCPKYYFNIVRIKSCIPQEGHSFLCYRDSNAKIIDLLGWKRLMKLEHYIATMNLNQALPLYVKAKTLRVNLSEEKEEECYHLIALHNIFPDEPIGVNSEELLSCASETKEFLASLFNKYGEKESSLHCSAGRIDLEGLMEINHQYQNLPREP